jgi:hypothetical protein
LAWAEKVTGRGGRQCQRYVQLAVLEDIPKFAKGLHEAIGHPNAPWAERKQHIIDEAQAEAQVQAAIEVENERQAAIVFKEERRQQQTMMLKLIDVGYKSLALKFHPDAGGSADGMMLLKASKDTLMAYAERWA